MLLIKFSPELCGLLGEVLAGTESPGTTPAAEGCPPWSLPIELLCGWAGFAVELCGFGLSKFLRSDSARSFSRAYLWYASPRSELLEGQSTKRAELVSKQSNFYNS